MDAEMRKSSSRSSQRQAPPQSIPIPPPLIDPWRNKICAKLQDEEDFTFGSLRDVYGNRCFDNCTLDLPSDELSSAYLEDSIFAISRAGRGDSDESDAKSISSFGATDCSPSSIGQYGTTFVDSPAEAFSTNPGFEYRAYPYSSMPPETWLRIEKGVHAFHITINLPGFDRQSVTIATGCDEGARRTRRKARRLWNLSTLQTTDRSSSPGSMSSRSSFSSSFGSISSHSSHEEGPNMVKTIHILADAFVKPRQESQEESCPVDDADPLLETPRPRESSSLPTGILATRQSFDLTPKAHPTTSREVWDWTVPGTSRLDTLLSSHEQLSESPLQDPDSDRPSSAPLTLSKESQSANPDRRPMRVKHFERKIWLEDAVNLPLTTASWLEDDILSITIPFDSSTRTL